MEKKNEITFCVKSKYALYSDPLNRVSGEKFSYQIPTYEALKEMCIRDRKNIRWGFSSYLISD